MVQQRACSKARLLGPTPVWFCALFTPVQYIAQRTVSRGTFKRNEIFISPGYSQSALVYSLLFLKLTLLVKVRTDKA